jgi:RND family efflux transporter MFP subunit
MIQEPSLNTQSLRPAHSRRSYLLSVVALLTVVGVIAWLALKGRPSHLLPAESLPTVGAVRVRRGDLATEVGFAAEFRPWFSVELHAKTAGFIRLLHVDIGSKVHAGDVLAELEVPLLKEDLARAEASLRRNQEDFRRAEANAEEAHLGATRLDGVARSQPRLIAQQELDAARAKDRAAAASLGVAREQIHVAEADLARLRAEESDTLIRAPFDGVVTRLLANPGDFVLGGLAPSGQAKAVVRLSQLNKLRLSFPVSVSYLDSVVEGASLEIRRDTGRTITNRISRLSREVSPATRMMDVEADIENDDLVLVPGSYATVILHPQKRIQVLHVPVECLQRKPDLAVLVVNDEHVLERRPVRTGLETPASVELLEGVKEGEWVVTSGGNRVKPGQKVEVKTPASTTQEATR